MCCNSAKDWRLNNNISSPWMVWCVWLSMVLKHSAEAVLGNCFCWQNHWTTYTSWAAEHIRWVAACSPKWAPATPFKLHCNTYCVEEFWGHANVSLQVLCVVTMKCTKCLMIWSIHLVSLTQTFLLLLLFKTFPTLTTQKQPAVVFGWRQAWHGWCAWGFFSHWLGVWWASSM